MLLGFKTEVNLNNEQRTILAKHAGTARHAYNQGLALTQHLLNLYPQRLPEQTHNLSS